MPKNKRNVWDWQGLHWQRIMRWWVTTIWVCRRPQKHSTKRIPHIKVNYNHANFKQSMEWTLINHLSWLTWLKQGMFLSLLFFRERKEELWVKGSFYAFMATSAYMFLKRFYLHELLGLAFWLLSYIFTFVYDGVNYMLSLMNMSTVDLFVDLTCCEDIASPFLFMPILLQLWKIKPIFAQNKIYLT